MKPDFKKYPDGLMPAVIQDQKTLSVLMVGFMNQEALEQTQKTGKVTFFSRSKGRLWTKGEESGNFLYFKRFWLDCDKDTLLIEALPVGPVCHTGQATCFGAQLDKNFLFQLDKLIASRKANPQPESYTSKLLASETGKVAQKVGEEAVELVIEAISENPELFLSEAADLLFHYLILLHKKDFSLSDVINILERRHKNTKSND